MTLSICDQTVAREHVRVRNPRRFTQDVMADLRDNLVEPSILASIDRGVMTRHLDAATERVLARYRANKHQLRDELQAAFD